MGAIAGAVHLGTLVARDVVSTMLSVQRHRAPGYAPSTYVWRSVQMGSFGVPLQHNRMGTIYVAVDGTITGEKHLRAKLKAQGLPVQPQSSVSELIIMAYERWDREFVDHIAGQIAFVLLDKERKVLFLVRDRLGCKPLYWFHSGNTFLFSSEVKGLLHTGIVPQQPDLQALATHLALGYFPQDVTPIAGVSKLLPGHFLEFHLDGHKRVVSYWSYATTFGQNRTDPEQGLDHLLREALEERAQRYPQMGCYLGGGLGSAGVAAYASEAAPARLRGYSTIFAEQNEEDGRVAASIASHLNIPMHMQTIRSDQILRDLPTIMWHLEEPVALSNLLSTWLFAKEARGQGAVLSGMGSDELLAGHTRYQAGATAPGLTRRLADLPTWMLQRFALPVLERIAPRTAYRVLRHTLTDADKVHHLHAGALFDENVLAVASPQLAPLWDLDTYIQRFYQDTPIKGGIEALLYLDTQTRLIDAYILHFERLTSAFGLDWQAPFLDISIVEFLIGLPIEAKCTAEETAIPLRKILQSRLPEGVVQRPKRDRRRFLMGWGSEPKIHQAFEALKHGTLAEVGLISRRWLERTLQQGAGDERAFDRLWACLLLETWFRIFINQPLTTKAPTMDLAELFELFPSGMK